MSARGVLSWPRAILFAFACVLAGTAGAGEFAVSPIRIELGPAARTGAFVVRNEGKEPLSIQVRGMAWLQDAQGQDQYEDSSEIVYFPRLLTIEPGKEGVIRVGIRQPPADRERTYRLFIEELPAAGVPEAERKAALSFLVRFGAPVFVKPLRIVDQVELGEPRAAGGKVSFDVRNTGNQHQVVEGIVVRGLAADGQELFTTTLTDRYLLAGTRKHYIAPIPAHACARVARVVADVRTDKSRTSGQTSVDPSACQ